MKKNSWKKPLRCVSCIQRNSSLGGNCIFLFSNFKEQRNGIKKLFSNNFLLRNTLYDVLWS